MSSGTKDQKNKTVATATVTKGYGYGSKGHLMRWERLFQKVKDACVSIESINRERTLNKNGSGYIIKVKGCYYIMSSFRTVFERIIENALTGENNYMIWDEIYALISGINGSRKSRYYRLKLLAVDGAADLALLEIANNHNQHLPKLCNHTYLEFSKKKPKHGQLIATVGFAGQSFGVVPPPIEKTFDHQSITTGIIREPNYLGSSVKADSNTFQIIDFMDPLSYILYDLGDINQESYSGAPIFDPSGKIVGMQSFRYGSSLSGGPKSDDICSFVERFFNCPNHFSKTHPDGIPLMSTLGSYVRYLKGYLGLNLDIFGSGNDLFRYLPSGQEWPNRNVSGAVIIGADPNGGWNKSDLPHIGITGPAKYVLLKVNDCPLGTVEKGQISIADVTWNLLPGKKIKVEYVSLDEYFTGTTSLTGILTLEDWPTFNVNLIGGASGDVTQPGIN